MVEFLADNTSSCGFLWYIVLSLVSLSCLGEISVLGHLTETAIITIP